MIKSQIQWTSNTKYVDVSTGELIEKQEINKYQIIKTTKYANVNYKKTKGHIEYTKQCRRKPDQGKLNLD